MENLPILKKKIEDYSSFWVLAFFNLVSCGLFLTGLLLFLFAGLCLFIALVDGIYPLTYYFSLAPYLLLGMIFIWRGAGAVADGIKSYIKKDEDFRTKFLTSFLPIALIGVLLFVALCFIMFSIAFEPKILTDVLTD